MVCRLVAKLAKDIRRAAAGLSERSLTAPVTRGCHSMVAAARRRRQRQDLAAFLVRGEMHEKYFVDLLALQ